MAKKIVKKINLAIPAGRATPAPPVGTALGPAGINSNDFCMKYNEATKDKIGDIIPVVIYVYEDRTYDFITKTPPTSSLIKKYAKIEKGSTKGGKEIIGKLTKDDLKTIAEIKLVDSNSYDLEQCIKSVEGTARNMGVEIV